MDERLSVIADQLGVFTRAEALAVGYDDRSIARKVAAGEWTRVRRGAYLPTEVWDSLDQRGRHRRSSRAVLRNSQCVAALTHASGLAEYEVPLWEIPLDVVHLTRFDKRSGRSEAGVRQHYGLTTVNDLTLRNGLLVGSATRLALEAISLVDTEPAIAVIDALIHEGSTTPQLLRWRSETMRHWSHTLRMDYVIRLVDGRSESVGESRSRYLCFTQGLPAPVPQYEVVVAGRVIARLDLAWPDRKVWVEFDGMEKYVVHLRDGESTADAVLREKRREDQIRLATGWRCLRITWADLYSPGRVAAEIRRLFAEQAAA